MKHVVPVLLMAAFIICVYEATIHINRSLVVGNGQGGIVYFRDGHAANGEKIVVLYTVNNDIARVECWRERRLTIYPGDEVRAVRFGYRIGETRFESYMNGGPR